jgi:hypothetical protein
MNYKTLLALASTTKREASSIQRMGSLVCHSCNSLSFKQKTNSCLDGWERLPQPSRLFAVVCGVSSGTRFTFDLEAKFSDELRQEISHKLIKESRAHKKPKKQKKKEEKKKKKKKKKTKS